MTQPSTQLSRREQLLQALATRRTEKAANYSARSGETIVGNLKRGADGRFTSAGGASATPKPRSQAQQNAYNRGVANARKKIEAERAKRKKGGGGGKAKPKVVKPEKPTKAEQQAANRQSVIDQMADTDQGLSIAGAQGLLAFADGAPLANPEFAKIGLVEGDPPRLTKEGRAAVDAMNKGDARAAIDAIAAAREKADAAAQPKAGGGGGGSAKKTEEEKAEEKRRQQAANRAKTAEQAGMTADEADMLAAIAEGKNTFTAQQIVNLEEMGLTSDGEATDAGRRALNAMERGDLRGTLAAIQDGKARVAREREESERRREAERKRLEEERRRQTTKEASHLTIRKQADGRWRWLLVSSTAYEDRDREWVTKGALERDVRRADRVKEYGPLYWWHTRYVIGHGDFNMMAGPLLIESGTFLNETIGKAMSENADRMGASLDFKRLPWEPGPKRTYTLIRRVGRSLLPRDRASNLFTSLAVYKEKRMTEEEKLDVLADLLGISRDQTKQMLDQHVTKTEQAAASAGVVAKAATEPTVTKEAVATEEAVKADDMVEVEVEPADPEEGSSALFSPEELSEIARVIAPMVAAAVIEQLTPQLNMETKLTKMADEIKGIVGGLFTQKDDAAAKERERIEKLEAALKETSDRLDVLEGDQPAAFHRPSMDAGNTMLGAALAELVQKQKAATKIADPLDSVVDDVLGFAAASS